MLADLRDWSVLSDMIEANCTIKFKVPDATKTYHPVSGNVEFSHREISIRAYVFEDDSLTNRGPKDTSIGVDTQAKQLVAIVQSVDDPLNPALPDKLLPPSVADMAECELTMDYPTGLKRSGTGVIRIEALDNYKVHETFGELFYIRFVPDRARRA